MLFDRDGHDAEFGGGQALLNLLSDQVAFLFAGHVGIPDSCEGTKTVLPYLLSPGEGDEGLGGPFVFFPEIVVFGSNLVQIDWKTGVPITTVIRILQPGEIRHEAWVCVGLFQRDNLSHGESCRGLFQSASHSHHEIAHVNAVTWFGFQIICEPLIDDDFVVFHVVWQELRFRGGHHGKGRFDVTFLDAVDEIGQQSLAFIRSLEG